MVKLLKKIDNKLLKKYLKLKIIKMHSKFINHDNNYYIVEIIK